MNALAAQAAPRQIWLLLKLQLHQSLWLWVGVSSILIAGSIAVSRFESLSFSPLNDPVTLSFLDAQFICPFLFVYLFTSRSLAGRFRLRRHIGSFIPLLLALPLDRVRIYRALNLHAYLFIVWCGLLMLVPRLLASPDLHLYMDRLGDLDYLSKNFPHAPAYVSGLSGSMDISGGRVTYAFRQLYLLLAYAMVSQIFLALIDREERHSLLVYVYIGCGVCWPLLGNGLFDILHLGDWIPGWERPHNLGTIVFVWYAQYQFILWPLLLIAFVATQMWSERRFIARELES